MIAKLPIISSPATAADIAAAAGRMRDRAVTGLFAAELARYTGLAYGAAMNSGIACYYRILEALKERYGRTEVVLPAYTAGSLVVAIRKAGLKPVLCDISLGDFNADVNDLAGRISEKTLAVTCVHMFGIGMEGIARVKAELPPSTVLIEDCCQSMGTSIGGRLTGAFGDISFFSFNRGKNLALSGGGYLATGSSLLAKAVEAWAATGRLPAKAGVADAVKSVAFLAAAEPHLYGALFGVASRFKENAPPADIETGALSTFQAALGLALMERREAIFSCRRRNGAALAEGLQEVKGILLPVVPVSVSCVYNRFPVVFEDAAMRTRAETLLWRAGIETSRMYLRPLHHMFDLGYRESDFPHARYVAQRLLTLPVHAAVSAGHIATMIGTIRSALRAV